MPEILPIVLGVIIILFFASGRVSWKTRKMGVNPKPPTGPRPDVTPAPLRPPRVGQNNFIPDDLPDALQTAQLFQALNNIDAEKFKVLVCNRVMRGINRGTYNFFSHITEDHQTYTILANMQNLTNTQNLVDKNQEKNSKLQWIEKQEDK